MSASAPGVRVPAHERVIFDNGLTLIVLPRRDVPLVAFNAILRGGAQEDAPRRPGTAAVVAGLLEKGAGDRDAFAFADAVEGVGGTFGAGAGPESIVLRGQFLARDQRLMLDLLADALLRPRFEEEELDILRNRQIELIKAAKDSDPSELLGLYGRAFLFRDHPFGRSVVGSERSLAAITHDEVLGYYRAHFGADRLILVVSGDVDTDWLQQAVARSFARWPAAGERLVKLPQPLRLTRRETLLVESPNSAQTYFWIGNVGVDRYYKRRAALDLANSLYGGRFTSILNSELRVKSGLSYGARSGFVRGSVAGEFAIRTFTRAEETERALELTLSTLEQLKRTALTASMLDSTRGYLLGQFPLNFETASDWSHALGELELFGLGPGQIEDYAAELQAVTLPEMEAVISEAFPSPEEVAIVLIGDESKLGVDIGRYGPLARTPLLKPDFDVVSGGVVRGELALA